MILNRLLARLHRIFNKSPKGHPVLSVSGPYVNLVVADLVATLVLPGAVTQMVMATDGTCWKLIQTDLGGGVYVNAWESFAWDGSSVSTALQTYDGQTWQPISVDLGSGQFGLSWKRIAGDGSVAPAKILDITGQAWAVVGDSETLSLLSLGNLSTDGVGIPFGNMTISQLATALTVYGFTATLLDASYSSAPARGLFETVEQIGPTPINLLYPTSLFYKEMQVYGWIQDEQHARIQSAVDQVDLSKAQDEWLDYWGSFFGAAREPGETDEQYGPRMFWQVIRPTQNNFALEMIVKEALGYEVTITDAMSVYDTLTTDLQEKAPGRFLMDLTHDASLSSDDVTAMMTRTMALVRQYKAGGFDFLQQTTRSNTPIEEDASISEGIALKVGVQLADSPQPGFIIAGAGWISGTPGIVAGLNTAMKEQVRIAVILASDGSTQSVVLLGG